MALFICRLSSHLFLTFRELTSFKLGDRVRWCVVISPNMVTPNSDVHRGGQGEEEGNRRGHFVLPLMYSDVTALDSTGSWLEDYLV